MRSSGFTLLELLVVIAIIGILASLFFIIPRDGSAVRAAAYDISTKVTRARMEALRSNEYVGLRVDPTAKTIFLFQDNDRDLVYDNPGDLVLNGTTAQLGANEYGIVKLAAATPSTGYTLVYDTRGIARTASPFTITLTNPSASVTRSVAVTAQGRSIVQ